MVRFFSAFIFIATLLAGVPVAFVPSYAQTEGEAHPAFSNSGLPIPRFVSLSKNETNLRVGPGKKYPVKNKYTRGQIPVEVILEYDNWRKIRDIDGEEGWVYHTLLSGKRYGIIQAENVVYGYKKDHRGSQPLLALEPGATVVLKECRDMWCYGFSSGFSGWIERKFIWGVYENENFD